MALAAGALMTLVMGTGDAAPLDCAAMPISLSGAENSQCSVTTRFDFDAFHINQHYKRFSVPPAIIPGLDARGVIHEIRGRSADGADLYAALARATPATHVRFMNDLKAWAAAGWLPWRSGADSDWSATATITLATGKWYFGRFSLGDMRCLVVQRYQTLHENGFLYAIIAATCRAEATYGMAEAARLAASVRIKGPLATN